ncbi:MAG: hypothetical protein COB93_00730 [Sneathiella sp.]|nr:MAG: hypothetical protein COB93_00730 [Sneathiella sp.]
MVDKVEFESRGRNVRSLLRRATTAALGTIMPETTAPYCSLVIVATDPISRPLLLLSDLAVHSRNIAATSDVSLLISSTAENTDPLTEPRVTMQGRIVRNKDKTAAQRYLRRYPSAREFAGFSDFHFYQFEPTRAHLVAGFGQINWLEAADFLLPPHFFGSDEVELDIIDHMNRDHRSAVQEIAAMSPNGQPREGWDVIAIDPEGMDLRAGWQYKRILFRAAVSTPDEVRAQLVQLLRGARN